MVSHFIKKGHDVFGNFREKLIIHIWQYIAETKAYQSSGKCTSRHQYPKDEIRFYQARSAPWIPKQASYLRGNVIRCPTKGLGDLVSQDFLFAHAKVCNLDVTILIQQDIIQLQVSVDHAMTMQIE